MTCNGAQVLRPEEAMSAEEIGALIEHPPVPCAAPEELLIGVMRRILATLRYGETRA